jgi:hypothetical protein
MDPYLENPAWWSGLHHRFVNVTSDLLQPILLDRGYYVDINERVWLVNADRDVLPDLVAYHHARKTPSGAAVAAKDEPVRVQRKRIEIRESYLEIYDRAGDRLITSVELLSPTNKSQTEGRRLYTQKQREVQEAGVHLVEIDLLRSGIHTVDVPLDLLVGFQPWHYLVNIVRAQGAEYEFYPIPLRERLPRIGIPLKLGDNDVTLDLQAVLDRVYDAGPYALRVDYQGDPPMPLSPADGAWVDEVLKQKGLRN